MRDVIPTGTTRDSAFLFEGMTRATLGALQVQAGARVLDVASGFGQDSAALCARGVRAVGAEPSARMSAWAKLQAGPSPQPEWVRAWSDALPFADASFDACFCKGALDHFDRPLRAIGEMARVTKARGRVVLAIANFESLACRAARALDVVREVWLRRAPARGRRIYDVPSDHFTRFEPELMREQVLRHLVLEQCFGISIGWGFAPWMKLCEALPAGAALRALRALDALARRRLHWADVVVLAGRPKG